MRIDIDQPSVALLRASEVDIKRAAMASLKTPTDGEVQELNCASFAENRRTREQFVRCLFRGPATRSVDVPGLSFVRFQNVLRAVSKE